MSSAAILKTMSPALNKVFNIINSILSHRFTFYIIRLLFQFAYLLSVLPLPLKEVLLQYSMIINRIVRIFSLNPWLILSLFLCIMLCHYVADLRNNKLNYLRMTGLLLLSLIFPIINATAAVYAIRFFSFYLDYSGKQFLIITILIAILASVLHILYIYLCYKIASSKVQITIIAFYNTSLAVLLYYVCSISTFTELITREIKY